eukprot:1176913-Prorocentrum_minimum.AAC.2
MSLHLNICKFKSTFIRAPVNINTVSLKNKGNGRRADLAKVCDTFRGRCALKVAAKMHVLFETQMWGNVKF